MLKIWDLAKKSHFASVLTTDAAYANFLHTMMNYIENGIHDQFLEKNVDEISHSTASTTVKSEIFFDLGLFSTIFSITYLPIVEINRRSCK